MKTFIYSKKTSKKIATITNVVRVQEIADEDRIQVITESGEVLGFDTSQVKTTIYQN